MVDNLHDCKRRSLSFQFSKHQVGYRLTKLLFRFGDFLRLEILLTICWLLVFGSIVNFINSCSFVVLVCCSSTYMCCVELSFCFLFCMLALSYRISVICDFVLLFFSSIPFIILLFNFSGRFSCEMWERYIFLLPHGGTEQFSRSG